MKFKTNHSLGPWSFDCHDIRDANGQYIIDTDDVQSIFDIKAITQVPAMLEYMMNRAKYLYSLTLNDVLRKPRPRPMDRDDEWEELDKILAILKDASVEAVEK